MQLQTLIIIAMGRRFKILATGLAAAVMATSACVRQEPTVPDIRPEEETEVKLVFSSGVTMESSLWTKARNTVDVEEDRITGAALAIYDSNGVLVHTDRVAGEFTGFSQAVSLNKDREYSCYLVTGYIAGEIVFPERESGLQTLQVENTMKNGDGNYDMTAALRDYGPDRAGSIKSLKPAMLDREDGVEDGIVTIPVKSLWAKVSVSFEPDAVSGYEVGLYYGGTESCGALMGSRIFMPFSTTGCRNVSDSFALLPMETRTADGGMPDASEPFVFFVPENMFGNLLADNSDSDRKTPAAVEAIHGAAVAQAVERSSVAVSCPAYAPWGDLGTLTYRFCLGDNTTSNFDIRRNTLYNVVLTATENGFAIKEWKAELDLTDTRSMLFRAPFRKVGADGKPFFADTSHAYVNVSGVFYLIPDYLARRINRTVAQYGAVPGWKLTTASMDLLESLGITYALQKKYVYIKTDSPDIFIEDAAASDNRNTVYYERVRIKTDVMAFTPSADLTTGMSFPITAQTYDGVHSATVTVHVRADGSAVVDWDHEPQYIAQQGLLRTTAMTGSVNSVSFSVPAQYADYIDIDASAGDGTCIVKAKKAGDVYVAYNGLSSQGTVICTGSVPLSIRTPILRAGTSICNLSADGTAVTLTPYYVSGDGTAMTLAGTDALGYGDRFSPTLYNALLAPKVSVSDGLAAPFLGAEGTQAYVARLESGGQGIDDLLGCTFADAITVSAKAAPDVNPASCDVFLKTPLGYIGTDRKLATIDNHVLTGLQTAHFASTAVKKGETVTVSGVSFTLGANIANLSIEEAGDISFSIGSGGTLCAAGKAAPTSLTAGRKVLYAVCRNTRSGQTVSVPSGYLEVYLHTVPKAVIDLTTAWPEVSTDIAGATLSPALSSMRTALFADAAAVKCSFFNGSFYDLGQGHWNYIDEFDSSGNQHTAPDQSGMMTEFVETQWPGMARFGQTAYSIDIGSIEFDYGKYNSLAAFLSWNEGAHLLMDYSGLTCVQRSPLKSTMYHYNYGTERDSYGYSYYILDYITTPGWKQ